MNRFRTIFAFAFLAVPWSAHADDRCPENRWPCAVGKPADTVLTSETGAERSAEDGWKTVAYARIVVPANAKVFVDGRSLKDRGTLRWYRWTPSKDEPSKYVTLTATWQDRVTRATKKHTRKIVMRPGKIRPVTLCGASLESIVDAVIWRTNLQRQRFGIAPVVENSMLTAAAQKHADNLARQEKLSHQLNGEGFLERSRHEGYRFMAGGENIAEGSSSSTTSWRCGCVRRSTGETCSARSTLKSASEQPGPPAAPGMTSKCSAVPQRTLLNHRNRELPAER